MQVDGAGPIPGLDEPVDAVLVTVGAWDIEPSWLDHLSAEGTLVVPLRMCGITRVIAFRREGGHLVSTSSEVAGFVAMQGRARKDERVLSLRDPSGSHVRLRFDGEVPADADSLEGVLATERTEMWSGVEIPDGVSFADLHLWFAAFLAGFCRVAADPGTEMADQRGWFPFAAVRDGSFAYLAVRPLPGGGGLEFGARAYGKQGRDAAYAMVEQIQAWDRAGRDHAPTYAYWPAGSGSPESGHCTALLVKRYGVVAVSW